MNEHIEYLITELVKAEIWREGCLAAFGREVESEAELVDAVKEYGREIVYKANTYNFAGAADNFEDFCKNKVLGYPRNEYLIQAMLIKAFEKELRKDYEAYCKEVTAEDNR